MQTFSDCLWREFWSLYTVTFWQKVVFLKRNRTCNYTIFNKMCFFSLSLQEEIQKLAGQIQYLKIVGMLMENRHIKPKKDGYFSKENCSKHFQHFLIRVRHIEQNKYVCKIEQIKTIILLFLLEWYSHKLFWTSFWVKKQKTTGWKSQQKW